MNYKIESSLYCTIFLLLIVFISFSPILADNNDGESNNPAIPWTRVDILEDKSDFYFVRDGRAKLVFESWTCIPNDREHYVHIDWGDGETDFLVCNEGIHTVTHEYDSDIGFFELLKIQRWDGEINAYDNYPDVWADKEKFEIESSGILLDPLFNFLNFIPEPIANFIIFIFLFFDIIVFI